jgi:hypothetical protein
MIRSRVRLNREAEVLSGFRKAARYDNIAIEVSQIIRVFHILAGKNRKVNTS